MCGESEHARLHFEEFRKLNEEEGRAKRATHRTYTDETRIRNTVVRLCLAASGIYMQNDRPQSAEQLWRRAAQLDPQDRQSRDSLCEWLIYEGRLAEALPFSSALCELDPRNPRQRLRLGILYAQTDKVDEAASAFGKVIEIAPADAAGYAALAEIQMLPGRDLAEALRLAEKAVALESSAPHYYLLATAQRNFGDVPSARASLVEAIRLNPGEPQYRAAYAQLANEPR
jgi:adsorption protein A